MRVLERALTNKIHCRKARLAVRGQGGGDEEGRGTGGVGDAKIQRRGKLSERGLYRIGVVYVVLKLVCLVISIAAFAQVPTFESLYQYGNFFVPL
jgi:hypothetical protein